MVGALPVIPSRAMSRALVIMMAAALAAGCGKVSGAAPDAPAEDASIDGSPDAFVGCITDEFNGVGLDPAWDPAAVGQAPTVMFGGGVMTIIDAAFADTPSMSDTSWVYDLDTDLGNQMARPVPVGTRDFDLSIDFGWSSAATDLTLAAVGLVGADHHLEVIAGVEDDTSSGVGGPSARIRRAGPDFDVRWSGTAAATGTSKLAVHR